MNMAFFFCFLIIEEMLAHCGKKKSENTKKHEEESEYHPEGYRQRCRHWHSEAHPSRWPLRVSAHPHWLILRRHH